MVGFVEVIVSRAANHSKKQCNSFLPLSDDLVKLSKKLRARKGKLLPTEFACLPSPKLGGKHSAKSFSLPVPLLCISLTAHPVTFRRAGG